MVVTLCRKSATLYNYNIISVSLYDRIVIRRSVARQSFPSRLLLSPSSPEQRPGIRTINQTTHVRTCTVHGVCRLLITIYVFHFFMYSFLPDRSQHPREWPHPTNHFHTQTHFWWEETMPSPSGWQSLQGCRETLSSMRSSVLESPDAISLSLHVALVARAPLVHRRTITSSPFGPPAATAGPQHQLGEG